MKRQQKAADLAAEAGGWAEVAVVNVPNGQIPGVLEGGRGKW